jgi:hypothetical protein
MGALTLWPAASQAVCTQSIIDVMPKTMVIGTTILVNWTINPHRDTPGQRPTPVLPGGRG